MPESNKEQVSLIRGSGKDSKAELDTMFIARVEYNFGISLKNWPNISNYHALVSEVMNKNNIENECHFWWTLIYTNQDKDRNEDFWVSGINLSLGKIVREAILDKYPSVNAYGKSASTPIKKVFALRFIGGTALPRYATMTAIAVDLGYANLFDLVKTILDREVKGRQ